MGYIVQNAFIPHNMGGRYVRAVIYREQHFFLVVDCCRCEHLFARNLPEIRPNRRAHGLQGCLRETLVVAGRVVVPGINDLASKKPELLKDWNYEKNTVSPKEVTCGSHKKVWWKCHKCGYEWQTTPHNRTGNNRTGCPKCSRTHRSETQK